MTTLSVDIPRTTAPAAQAKPAPIRLTWPVLVAGSVAVISMALLILAASEADTALRQAAGYAYLFAIVAGVPALLHAERKASR